MPSLSAWALQKAPFRGLNLLAKKMRHPLLLSKDMRGRLAAIYKSN